jgi:hypothetical protein
VGSFSMVIAIPVTSLSIYLASLRPANHRLVISCKRPVPCDGTTTIPCKPTRCNALELGVTHNCRVVLNVRVAYRYMKIFGVNTPYLPHRACTRGFRVSLRCIPRPKCSSSGVIQSTDDTWWLGEDAWLLLNSVPLGSPWSRVISGPSRGERPGLGATGCMVVRTQPRPGAGAGCHETRGDLRPDSGRGRGVDSSAVGYVAER